MKVMQLKDNQSKQDVYSETYEQTHFSLCCYKKQTDSTSAFNVKQNPHAVIVQIVIS